LVAENGNKLLPVTAAIGCRFWQQIVAVFGNNLLPFWPTICCLVWTGLKVHESTEKTLTVKDSFYLA